MAKMLGQDLFTQEEFDQFKDGDFSKVIADIATINDKKADDAQVQSLCVKVKKHINTLYVGLGISLVANLGLMICVLKLLK